MDKTTRVVRNMVREEAEFRLAKNARLRAARLEREAHTPPKQKTATPTKRTPKADI